MDRVWVLMGGCLIYKDWVLAAYAKAMAAKRCLVLGARCLLALPTEAFFDHRNEVKVVAEVGC